LAGKYADWLYAHYGEILYNSNQMAGKAVLNLKEKIKTHPQLADQPPAHAIPLPFREGAGG